MKKALTIISLAFLLYGCGGSKKSNPVPVPVPPPKPATLATPAQNSVCITGTVISATTSTVSFTWDAGANTDSYIVVVKNLLTSDSTVQHTAQTSISSNLLRNTPYSWYVISRSNSVSATAQSAVWKFYNSGPGVVTYAPFPAEINSPTFGEVVSAATGSVNLDWTGGVIAPDAIASYDVYFGTTTSPPKTASAITNSFVDNVTVTANTTYYWHVVTRDTNGNTSDSGLYQFSVN